MPSFAGLVRAALLALGLAAAPLHAQSVAFSFDDGPILASTPRLSPRARNEAMLAALAKHKLKAALFVTAGLAGSNGEARRHVQGGAVRINDQLVSDDRRVVGTADLSEAGVVKLSLGKKKHILVRPV